MPEEVKDSIIKTLYSGFITEGDKAKEFESKFQSWIGNPNISLVNTGTSAMTIAIRLAGIKPGDEVISTPQTCLATNTPLFNAGAKIVWADIDPNTGNISPESIKERITDKTKAIVFVHWSGIPADIDAINKIAKKNNLKVIEDAAHALGAKYNNIKIGNHSDYVFFSFQAIKHITTVDGGALACKTKEDYERAVLLRWYGASRTQPKTAVQWSGDVSEAGWKMHMNDVTASIGIEQMKYIDSIISKHKNNANYLREHLKEIDGIQLLRVDKNIEPSFWIFSLKLPDENKRKIFSNLLTENGVGNSIVHTRNDAYSVFKDSRRNDLKGMDDFGNRMLNIPCGWWLSKEDLDYIIEVVKKAAEKMNSS